MNRNGRFLRTPSLVVLFVMVAMATTVFAQEQRGFLSLERGKAAISAQASGLHDPQKPAECIGPVSLITDVGFEGVKTTSFNWSNTTGGGESGRFDKTPVLTTKVRLEEKTCLDAHFSAIVGSAQTYGVAPITMFQVTLTPVGGAPQHMYGHYETPYGLYGPAVAVEAERDVDTFGANFFQRVGYDRGDIPPGDYYVDVWWSGGPVGGGGAIGAAFVLKLYSRG
jgi:hypothetical protein